jgi:glycosyltransferase involved in cell wall biosynthesis
MRRVLDDPKLAEELRLKGLQRAREFSWERSVEKTQRVYREVAADGRAVEMEHQAG